MHIPGYRIERLIAEGGMSSVYLATQESLGRRVVVKLLKRFDQPRQAQRFLHEAKVIASLQHQHVVTVYDVGTVAGRYYIAMEYLEGGSLADRIEEGMAPKMALDLLQSLAACLDFLHRHNVVHRDIKPSNILFHADGSLRLTDFGIALRLGEEQDALNGGGRFGSPHYLSPEQVEERAVDGRSDIYSLGIVFYQMLTGKRPYEAASPAETIVAHLSQPIPLLPEDLRAYQALCEQMLAKKPEDRVESARCLVERVQEVRALLQPGHAAGTGVKAMHAGFPLPGKAATAASTILAVAIGLLWWPGDYGPVQQVAPRLALPESAPVPAPVRGPDISADAAIPGRVGGIAAVGSVVHTDSETVVKSAVPAEPQTLPVVAVEPVSPQVPEPLAASVPTAPSPVDTDTAEPVAFEAPGNEEEGQLLLQSDAQTFGAWLEDGNTALRGDRLTTPANDNAYAYFKRVLAQDPGNANALSGIERIADRYAVLARRALAAGNLRRARLYLDRGTGVQADHAGLDALSDELALAERPPEPVRIAGIEPEPPSATPAQVTVIEFEGTSVTSRGIRGSGNIAKDLGHVWRSVFD